MWKKLLVLLLIAGAAHHWWPGGGASLEQSMTAVPVVALSPALSVDAPPLQDDGEDGGGAFRHGNFTITPVASFQVKARVLAARRYVADTESALSPLDLALGWGPMADPAVLEHVSITQGGRFYHWQVKEFPIPRREIETHSANMHMIPASPEVARALAALEAGQRVSLAGYLVDIRRDGGWSWRSSRTREDTGAGACEIILVQRVAVDG